MLQYPLLVVVEAIDSLQGTKGMTLKQICDFVVKQTKNPNDPMKVLKTIKTLNKLVDEGVLVKKGRRYIFSSKSGIQDKSRGVLSKSADSEHRYLKREVSDEEIEADSKRYIERESDGGGESYKRSVKARKRKLRDEAPLTRSKSVMRNMNKRSNIDKNYNAPCKKAFVRSNNNFRGRRRSNRDSINCYDTRSSARYRDAQKASSSIRRTIKSNRKISKYHYKNRSPMRALRDNHFHSLNLSDTLRQQVNHAMLPEVPLMDLDKDSSISKVDYDVCRHRSPTGSPPPNTPGVHLDRKESCCSNSDKKVRDGQFADGQRGILYEDDNNSGGKRSVDNVNSLPKVKEIKRFTEKVGDTVKEKHKREGSPVGIKESKEHPHMLSGSFRDKRKRNS